MQCPNCGNPLPAHANQCTACGTSLVAAAAGGGDSAISTLIPYKNGPALIGYYLGVFSLIPFLGLPLGLAAVPLGIAGLKRHKRNPTDKGKAHAWVAIICGSISILLYGGLIAFGIAAAVMNG